MDQRPTTSHYWGRLLLAATLATNLILVGLVVRRWHDSDQPLRPGQAASQRAPHSGRPGATTLDIRPDAWATLAGVEDASFVERLRAKGFPPSIVRAIIHAQVREKFAARYQAITNAAALLPYWRGPAFGLSVNPGLERERRALDREVLEQVNHLLGPSGEELSDAAVRMFRRDYGDISPAKIPEMRRIQADYADLLAEAQAASRGIALPEDAEAVAFLENAMRADLARLLSPRELEEVELRTSRTASQLRRDLWGFHPTEEEFRVLFRLRQLVDFQSGDLTATSASSARWTRDDASRQIAAEIERTLGPDRYAEYRRTMDPAWRSADRVVAQLGLPTWTTPQLVKVQEDITGRANAVHANAGLSPAQRAVELSTLAHEARSRLAPLLGQRGVARYEQTAPWLRSLAPPAR